MKEETKIIKSSWGMLDNISAETINPPRYRGSTVLFPSYEDMIKAGQGEYKGISYGTDRLPTQRQFEEAMRKLEGAATTRIFQSGIAAIQTALMAFTKSGDHILVCDNAYGPGQRFCKKVLKRFGVDFTLIPPDTGANIASHLQPHTKLVLLESPGSITMELQDIPAICAVAKEKGIITVLDSTWATPLYLKPFELGVDVTIHSVTKYISGYSDILAGTVSVNDKYCSEFERFYDLMEIYTPSEECYLALRGLNSLAIRLRQHEKSALIIAAWLQNHKLVDQVLHPALPSHPEYHIWKRDFLGSSGLFSFTLKEEPEKSKLAECINSLDLFKLGYSWGGYKSLLTAARISRNTPCNYTGKTVIRLNIGLEDATDLINDLEKGLKLLT